MGLFSRTTPEIKQIDTRNPQQQATDAFLINFLQKYGGQYQPGQAYGGKFTAPMTATENQGQDILSKWINGPLYGQQVKDAGDYFTKSINGSFDPRTSDQYAAFRDTAKINQADAIKNTKADLGATGKFFSSEAGNKYGDINMRTTAALNSNMSELANQERNRQQSNAQFAPTFDKYMQSVPLERATAASTIGAQPRLIENQQLEKMYQDFIRKQTELGGVVSGARPSNVGMSQYWTPGAPSGFESFMNSPLVSAIAPMALNAVAPGLGTAAGAFSGLFSGGGGFNPSTMSTPPAGWGPMPWK